MLKPPKLFPGATLGIVNTSYWVAEDIFLRTAQQYTQRGYRLKRGRSTELRQDLYAGSPEARAADILEMFRDPGVDAIICARGGYGVNRVLPLLDYDIIRENPKIFQGYSDVTACLTSITQRTGLVTFHGPMLVTHKRDVLEYNFIHMEGSLSGEEDRHAIQPPADFPATILKSGCAQGPLWGGNITLLANRLGTPDQLDTRGAVLFLEDIDEFYYSFDRQMYHFRQAGMFEHIRGLIIGEMLDMKDTETSFGKTVDEIVLDVCGDLDIPIVTNFPCGHGCYQATLPISLPVRLDAGGEQPVLEFAESPVI